MEGEIIIEKEKEKKVTLTLAVTVFLTCFGSSMLYGYNMAVMNLPADRIKCFLNRTILNVSCKDDYLQNISISSKNTEKLDADFFYAQTNTVFVIAGIIGAFSTGWVADFVGRRNGLLANHAFVIVGGVLNAFTVYANSPALLFIGRFLIGINAGVTIGLASMYLTEIAPRQYRGVIGACHQLAVTIGIVVGYIITMSHTLNTDTLWPVACGFTAIPAFISLVILPFCPESPRFLFSKKGDVNLAKKSFIRFNEIENVDQFFGELQEEVEIAKSQPKFQFIQLFKLKDLRMPLLIACLIQVMQQLSGINAVISYSSSMLSTAGIPHIYSQYCVIAIGILNVISTLISLPLIERFGRRTLLLWPTVLLAISLLLLTITVNLVNASDILSLDSKRVVGGISAALIMLYIIGFACGLGPVPALLVAEIFRQEPRGAAYSVSQAIQWTANLLVLFSYPNMNKAIGGYSFLPFLVVVIICWVFFFMFMPETKNRTFDEVATDLAFGTIVVGKKGRQLNKPITFRKGRSNNDDNEEERIL